MSCKLHLKKNTRGPKSPLFLLGIYQVRAPVRALSLFFFFFFIPFLFFFLFYSSFSLFPVSLSRGPFSSGTPGHCPPMTPSRYATAQNQRPEQMSNNLHLRWLNLENSGKNMKIYRTKMSSVTIFSFRGHSL